MFSVEGKKVLVAGLGPAGLAACALLRTRGAQVLAVDPAETVALKAEAEKLRLRGIDTVLGISAPPEGHFDCMVVSPEVSLSSRLVKEIGHRDIPVISELELGYQQSVCLNISVSGTNGKSTASRLIERVLVDNGLKTTLAGFESLPLTAVADRSKELDFLVLEVAAQQLEATQYFRPAIAVLLNISPDHLDRYANTAEYIKTLSRLFVNQQPFDWAVIQSEALAQLRSLQVKIPSKVITFSASNRRADIYLDRGMIISRLPEWEGLLLDMDDCQLQGMHNAENLMAALAVGRVLRLPLESMATALKNMEAPAHCCERVAQVDGVIYINDSKAANLDALHKALLAVPPTENSSEPNVWLIAGGKDKGFDFHDIGPLLSQRVKGAFLLGETQEKIRASWSLFTPCTLVDSLLEAVSLGAKSAAPGDVVLLSPACSCFDQFQNYQHQGDVFRQAVRELEKSSRRRAGARLESDPGAGNLMSRCEI